MASSIEPFQFALKFHQTIGICPSLNNREQCSFTMKNTIFLMSSAQFTLSAAAFFVYSADSMFEYGFGFYTSICGVNSTVMYGLWMWQMGNNLKFVKNCREFIERSMYLHKYLTLYLQLNHLKFQKKEIIHEPNTRKQSKTLIYSIKFVAWPSILS